MSAAPLPDFTLDELRSLLESGNNRLDGYLTQKEWQERLGVGSTKMTAFLQKAKKKGMLRLSHELREAIDGRMASVPVYAFALEKGEDK